MFTDVGASSFRLVVLAVALSSSFAVILALPAFPLSPNLSPVQVNTSSLLISPNPGPPQEPTCPPTEQWGVTLGHPSYDDCDYILSNLYPKDPLSKPVLRNFYVAPADVSHTMSNFKLPYEESYQTCSIQMLLAADFINIPNDEATWNDLRGATRTILRTCIRGRGLGGVITKNGKHGNIEIVVYGKDSIFAKNQILKNSPDQLARSIAAQELLELMNIVIVPETDQPESEVRTVANRTVNPTSESRLITAGVHVETS
ncbi:hypothetical protein HO173_005190 [Letharia columbiana]|uniref:Uncharacterized protein n=1 Tax=Letharia columbiana TaxID=112416 RepID=A0A8H6FXX0_9LECA|nr:uncharacterized protein HO173_005190 [Letharia columbiana]KAF6236899.1 hypothetical protein HO173_005190 [Letharia columbiana]